MAFFDNFLKGEIFQMPVKKNKIHCQVVELNTVSKVL